MVGHLRLLAALALGVAAACGSSDSSSTGGGSGNLSGELAGAGSSAQEAAQEAWIAEFENENSGVTISYDPVGSGGGREQFIAGGVAYAGSDAALEEEEGELKKAAQALRARPADRDPGLRLADRGHLQPRRRRRAAALAGNAGEDLQPGNHQLERPGDRRGQPRRRTARHPDHPGQPLRRVGHDGELHRLPLQGRPQRSGRTKSAATGRSRAARPPRAPRASSKRSRPATARSATPTPARPANSASPRSRSATNTSNRRAEAAAAILDESPEAKDEREDAYMFPFELDRKTEAQGTYPIVLASYVIACTKYGSARRSRDRQGLPRIRDQPRRAGSGRRKRRLGSAREGADRRRSSRRSTRSKRS